MSLKTFGSNQCKYLEHGLTDEDIDIFVLFFLHRFPCVRDRFGMMDDLDIDILSVVSWSLYSTLSREDDRDLLMTTLRSIGATEGSSPLHRVIAFIRHQEANSKVDTK